MFGVVASIVAFHVYHATATNPVVSPSISLMLYKDKGEASQGANTVGSMGVILMTILSASQTIAD
jgi:hypothetical protein